MKRVIFSVVSTVLGLIALLSFKSHSPSVVPVAQPASDPSTSPAATPAAGAKTYQGTAEVTRYGTVQVEVAVTGSRITNVSFLQLTSDDGRSAEINSQAGPVLLQETLSAQGADIDTVSGATYTSEGYLQSLQSALDQAGLK